MGGEANNRADGGALPQRAFAPSVGGSATFPNGARAATTFDAGIRLIGFEGRIDVAFEVQADRVVIIRVLYAGRQFDAG